jgi:hypothetical protein
MHISALWSMLFACKTIVCKRYGRHSPIYRALFLYPSVLTFGSFFSFFFSLDEVRMWVFEEILPTGKKLSESINEENVRTEAR